MLHSFVIPVILSIVVFHVAFVLGSWLISLVRKLMKSWIPSSVETASNEALASVGLATILGYGVLAYISLVCLLFGPLKLWLEWSIIVAVVLFGHRLVLDLYRQHYGAAVKTFKQWPIFNKIIFVFIALGILFYFTGAFVPPYRTDALAYHLPEATHMAAEGIHFPGTGSLFFSNLPVLMEVLYAFVFNIGGFTLVHLTHFQILLAGLLFVYTCLKRRFGDRTGLLAMLLAFTLYELFVDGTNAYVDAAATSFELVGLCLLVLWCEARGRTELALSGIAYGCALSIKYNALYGVGLAGILLLLTVVREKKAWREKIVSLLYWGLPLLLFCGFWYIKNAVVFHNPVYPFYFGHPGYTEAAYLDLVNTIKLFELPRTLWGFIILPFHFFLKSLYIPVFVAYILWPFCGLTRLDSPQKKWWAVFSYYAFGYALIWFFLATHQLKFFFVPMVLLLCICAHTLLFLFDRVSVILPRKVVYGIIALAVGVGLYGAAHAKNNYYVEVKKADVNYLLGRIDTQAFYNTKKIGEIYAFSQYVNTNFSSTTFFNVWASPAFFLDHNNHFADPAPLYYSGRSITLPELNQYLHERGLRYIIVDRNEEQQSFTEPVRVNNPSFVTYRGTLSQVSALVPLVGLKIAEIDHIELYTLRY